MELINLSPLSVMSLTALDNRGKEMLVVVVKATYVLNGSRPRLGGDQETIRMADEYHGDPGSSSLRYAGETTLYKPATDVILLGSAYPRGRDQRVVDVVLHAGKLQKTIRVFGDRRWEGRRWFERISVPLPFESIPLVFERAFGGIDNSDTIFPEAYPLNPVGMGFRARRSRRPVAGDPLPNIENPMQLIRTPRDRPDPAGMGFIAPHWEPRRSLAGTYDEKWQNEKAPFLPDDYDPLFQQLAPVDQIYHGYMEGGEPVVVENASANGKLSFRIPCVDLDVAVRIREDRHSLAMRLDTVVIDGDACSLRMVWRGSLSVHNRVYEVEWIKVATREET